MPLFQIDIQKVMLGEYWTNRYILNEASLATATDVGLRFVSYERNIHSTEVTFDKLAVRDNIENNDQYVITPLTGPGLRGAGTSHLPLFNVMRVDFGVGIGRPSRKYLRLPIYEEDMEDGIIGATLVNMVQNSYTTPILAEGSFVDVDGQDIVSAAIFNTIAMRQLRRGSRRRTTPVLE